MLGKPARPGGTATAPGFGLPVPLWWQRSNNGPQELFVQGNNLVRAVGSTTGNVPLARQYHLDARGTVAATSLASQALETRYTTDAFGNQLAGSAADNPAVYMGGLGYWEEPELTLQYVRNRWLNNATGTWLSVDSVATEPRYLYVGNSPTTATDPSGMSGLWDYVEGGVEREYHRAVHAFNRTVADALHEGEDALFASFKYFLHCAGVADSAATNIVAHIRRLGGDTVHLLNVIGHAIQSGICELKATYRSAVKQLPLWMQKLAPSPGFDALLEYAAGVAVAAIEVALYQIVPGIIIELVPYADIAMAILGIFSFVQELIRTGSLIQTFLSQIDGNIPEMIHQVQMHHGIYSNYQRGFITGSILASIVAGVLTILSFKHGLSEIGGKVANAFNEDGHGIFINLLRGLKNDTAATVEKISSIVHNVKKDPVEPDPDAPTGEIKGPTNKVRSGNTTEDRNESNAKGASKHKELERKYSSALPVHELLVTKFGRIIDHFIANSDQFSWLPEGEAGAKLKLLFIQVLIQLKARSSELYTYNQGPGGRLGGARVQKEGEILDEIFKDKGYDRIEYNPDSKHPTLEQTVRPTANELITTRDNVPGNIYTDRTYYNPTTKQIITVETVDTRGSLTRKGYPFGLHEREKTHAEILAKRQPNIPIFTIPKMKK